VTSGKYKKVDPVVGLLGKNGVVTQEIARDLICLDLRRKIKTTSQYARMFRAGQGTVQKAFKTLEDTGAIALESRGHLGTYLVERNLGLLWAISGLGTVTGVMPLPNSKEFEGTATALSALFGAEDVPLNLLHLNGAPRRVEYLKSGLADFVVLSRFSADQACADDPSLKVVLTGAPNSYYAQGSLTILTCVEAEDRLDDIVRVGIDATSRDHAEITHLEFDPSRVEFVQTPYHRIPDLILEGEIEAAVWHKTTRRVEAVSRELRFVPLRSEAAQRVSDDLCRLAILASRDDEPVLCLFDLVVDPRLLVEVQNEVIEGRRIPVF
jgi:hypothetical protein